MVAQTPKGIGRRGGRVPTRPNASSILGCGCLGFILCLAPSVAFGQPLSDFDKEAISSIRQMTLQLITISVGVYAFVGGILAQGSKKYDRTDLLIASFILFAISIGFGLLNYGQHIHELIGQNFTSQGGLLSLATGQWLGFFVGGAVLLVFLIINIDK
jgi:hypothetical protein